ncbi:MAG TPA: electron transport complex subunit RsxC [Phycisphaerae bacterium]|nr:electron transport complex subunit RsxC [Phycisphaerae bacterium]HUT58842.1 electron transport complex subunit RsxC [Phycisphaerae bacterium]
MALSAVSEASGKMTFARGVHPHDQKALSADQAVEVLPAPAAVAVPLLQHTGAPCEPTVKSKDAVALGQKIGDSKAFISAPVHASIAGAVQMLSVATLPNGRHVRTVPIKAAGEQIEGRALWEDVFGGDWPTSGLDAHEPKAIAEAVRAAGIVGLGGAAFPTHVKLTLNPSKPVDTLLVNGCECEPYLTADYRLMLEAPAPIVAGALLAARACGAGRIVLAIEDNKPAAIDEMRKAAGAGVEVLAVRTKYPMGGERQLAVAAMGREVPTGGLPLDVGVVVINVGTAAAVARAVLRGKPLTHRVVTVTGRGIGQPKNLLAPVGVRYGELIDYCGGLTADAARVVAGGPMMGQAVPSLDTPITKGTSGVVVLTREDVRQADETQCVRCGRCVDVCPLGLVPTKMALAAKNADWELARRYYIMACCECGCCAYVCPARIPLVQLIRVGKAQLPRD